MVRVVDKVYVEYEMSLKSGKERVWDESENRKRKGVRWGENIREEE